MKRFLPCAVALSLVAISASASDCNSLSSVQWLLGEWLAEGGKSTWRESWTAVGPRTWEVRGVETSKADPGKQGVEELRLVEMGGGVFYVAKVSHNEMPVAFRLVECGSDRLVFANPAHDFPRRLEYDRKADGRLSVRVSDGASRGFTLDFAKVAEAAADADAVLAAEDERFRAMIGADAGALRPTLDEGLAYVHMTGEVEDREQFIASVASGAKRYLAIAPGDRRVDILGSGAALVKGKARFQVEAGTQRLDFESRYLAVYARVGGAWRLRAWQSLRLP
jgi:hypothetical protein